MKFSDYSTLFTLRIIGIFALFAMGTIVFGMFDKAASPFEAAKAVLKDSTQPRWMRVIAGGALKLAEKEHEKEKQKHDVVD